MKLKHPHSIVTLHTTGDTAPGTHAVVSLPWPADEKSIPSSPDALLQCVDLFPDAESPSMKRQFCLLQNDAGLPKEVRIEKDTAQASHPHEVTINWHTLHETLDKEKYTYCEQEARLDDGKRSFGLRLGWMLQGTAGTSSEDFTWWQWCAAEPAWSGPLAEAWRLGGYLATCSRNSAGGFPKQNGSNLLELSRRIVEEQGDVLHADVWVVWWRSGLVQLRVHFKTPYFHVEPRPMHGFPVIALTNSGALPTEGNFSDNELQFPFGNGQISLEPSGLMFEQNSQGRWMHPENGTAVLQPWNDLRVLANKDRTNTHHYLPPASTDTMPEGVSRSFSLNISLEGKTPPVSRYSVPPEWYRSCGVLACTASGSATAAASRGADLIKSNTRRGGFDTGFVWRYLRRDLRTGTPEEDGAEWDGDTAAGLWTLAYQKGEDPSLFWPLYEAIAVHAADIAVHHGRCLQRLENSVSFTAPMPKARFRGILNAYLETGDPYLLDVSTELATTYINLQTANLPRVAIGRDAWPVTSLLELHDHTGDALYLRASRRIIHALLRTQQPDGGFSSQAGAGRLSGMSSMPSKASIGFGSGLLAPVAIFEWARRDSEHLPVDFSQRINRWVKLMQDCLQKEGYWSQNQEIPVPYPLITTSAFFTLPQAAGLAGDQGLLAALGKAVEYLEKTTTHVNGTHAFLGCLHAHWAEASLTNPPEQKKPTRKTTK